MLIGSYLGTLNEKRRVALPKRFLSDLGGKPIVAKWYEDCLILVSTDFWERLFKRLTGGRVIKYGIREIERFILGSAYETEPDDQGRIVIPEILSEYAHLKRDLVFVGLNDRVEIWPKEVWDRKSQDLAKTTKDYIETLSKD
jgi:MraZ protein